MSAWADDIRALQAKHDARCETCRWWLRYTPQSGYCGGEASTDAMFVCIDWRRTT